MLLLDVFNGRLTSFAFKITNNPCALLWSAISPFLVEGSTIDYSPAEVSEPNMFPGPPPSPKSGVKVVSAAGDRSRGCHPYHQGSDFDLLILGLLVDLLQERHPIGDDEGGPAQLGGGMDEGFHSHQLVNLPLGPTQGNHHLHDSLHAQQLVAQVKGPLQNSRHHLDGMECLIHVLWVDFAPAWDRGSQHMEQ